MGNVNQNFALYTLVVYFVVSTMQMDFAWCRRIIHQKQPAQWSFKVSQEMLTKVETNKFMLHAFGKMGSVNCVTFVWDNGLSRIVEFMSGCSVEIRACNAYKYEINFEEGNMTSEIMSTLSAGYQRQCGGYVILLRSPRSITQFLHMGDDMKLINTRARFLIWYDENDKKFEADDIWRKITNIILVHSKAKKTDIGIGSKVLFTVRGIRWPVIRNTTEIRTRVIEFWNYNGTDTEPSHQEWFYDKTTDWKKSTIKILVVDHPPGVLKSISPDGDVEYSGTEIEVVKALSVIMNFKYDFIDADPETKWGGQEEVNGTNMFYGGVARIISGEMDMGIGSFFILKHYLDHVDMSIPLDVACTSFLTPNPRPKSRLLSLVFPFRLELWLLVLVTCFIIGPVVLCGIARLAHAEYTDHAVFAKGFHTNLTSFRIMAQVALHIWPKTWPLRMYIGWYWIFWMCITISYRSTMISFLTIPLFEKPIDSYEDLAKSGLKIGGWGPELHRLFSEHDSSLQNDYRDILVDKFEVIEDLENGISNVAEGKFALFENLRFLRFIRLSRNLTNIGSPSMRIMRQCVVPVHIGFAYQKNSAITQTVNRYIRGFQESGLIKKWGQRVIAIAKEYGRRRELEAASSDGDEGAEDENSEDSEETATSPKSKGPKRLGIRDLQGTFILLLLGCALSILGFGAEIMWKRWDFRNSSSDTADLKIFIVKSKLFTKQEKVILDATMRKRKKKPRSIFMKKPPFPHIE